MSWIVLDLLAAFTMALSVCFAKKGSSKTDPCVAVGIFCASVCAMEIFIGRRTFNIVLLARFGQGDWLDILLAGLLLSLSWLFIFMAFKSGDATRVFSLGKLYLIFIPIIEILMDREDFPTGVIFASLFFLAGVIMFLIGSESSEWLFNSLIAASFYTAYHAVEGNVVAIGSFAVFVSHIIAFFLFIVMMMIKRSGETFKSLTFAHGSLLVLAGIAYKMSGLILDRAVECLGSSSPIFIDRLGCFDILFAAVLGIVMFKEEFSPKKFTGVALIIVALEILTL